MHVQGEKADAQIKVPAALIVVLLGLAAALLQHPHVASQLRLGPSTPRLVLPTQQQWLKGVHCLVQGRAACVAASSIGMVLEA